MHTIYLIHAQIIHVFISLLGLGLPSIYNVHDIPARLLLAIICLCTWDWNLVNSKSFANVHAVVCADQLLLWTITEAPTWSFVSGIHGRRKECLVSAVCACTKFSQKSGKPCYFGILPCNGRLQRQWWRVLISLGLTHNLHKWKPLRNDCVVIVLLITPWCCTMMY